MEETKDVLINEVKEEKNNNNIVFKFKYENNIAKLIAEVEKEGEKHIIKPRSGHNRCMGRGFEGWKNSIDQKNTKNNGYPIPCQCLTKKVGALIESNKFDYTLEVE